MELGLAQFRKRGVCKDLSLGCKVGCGSISNKDVQVLALINVAVCTGHNTGPLHVAASKAHIGNDRRVGTSCCPDRCVCLGAGGVGRWSDAVLGLLATPAQYCPMTSYHLPSSLQLHGYRMFAFTQ